MQEKSDKNQNQQVLAEGLSLAVIAMIILIVRANSPVQEFVLGVLVGLWIVAAMVFLYSAGRTFFARQR